jgi:CBS domain-containing protein
MKIEELMTRSPVSCRPHETLRAVEQKMEGCNCGCLPVTAGDGSRRLVGIITDGDIRMAARVQRRSLEALPVEDAMEKDVFACNPGDDLAEALAIMQEARVRRLPVVDESERLLGVISLADLAREAEGEHGAITEAEIDKILATLSGTRAIEVEIVTAETAVMVGP